MNKKVIIIGAGGHGKVIADIIEKSGDITTGFLDDTKKKGEIIIGNYSVIGKICDCEKMQQENPEVYFIVAIGDNKIRKELTEKYHLNYYTAIHPSANIGMDAIIEEGTAIMANACINPNAKVGKGCIINTGAIVEHDNILEDFVHLSPHATLCGTVKVGESTHIGAGAVVRNNLNITHDCVIGAGAVVVKNIEEVGTYIGVPCINIKDKIHEEIER